MNIRVLPSEQDDIVNSLNYEGIAVIELQFCHFPDNRQTACWLCHRLNSLNELAVMVISQPPGNNLHIIIIAATAFLNCSEWQDTLCSIRTVQHQGNS